MCIYIYHYINYIHIRFNQQAIKDETHKIKSMVGCPINFLNQLLG